MDLIFCMVLLIKVLSHNSSSNFLSAKVLWMIFKKYAYSVHYGSQEFCSTNGYIISTMISNVYEPYKWHIHGIWLCHFTSELDIYNMLICTSSARAFKGQFDINDRWKSYSYVRWTEMTIITLSVKLNVFEKQLAK